MTQEKPLKHFFVFSSPPPSCNTMFVISILMTETQQEMSNIV